MINLSIPRDEQEMKPRITVVGVGGAGGNAVNNMIRSNLVGCEFVTCNTDAQALAQSTAPRKIQLGIGVTRGLGAGSRPDVGRAAAEEALDEILEAIHGSNMAFITAGMGGGTGTGGAPVIARIARESGILTVGVVTKPFHFEGTHRMRLAIDAAEAAISNPLLEDVSMKGARGVLINITGGMDMTLFEVDEAANRIREEVDPDANIIFGSTFDERLSGKMRISVVATGIDAEAISQPRPALSLVSSRDGLAVSGLREATSGGYAQPMLTQNAAAPLADGGREALRPEIDSEPLPHAAEAAETAAVRGGAFIAPKPVDAGPARTVPLTQPAVPPAAVAKEPTPKPKGRVPSLIERVTGVGRGRSNPPDPTPRPAAPPAKAVAQPRLAPLEPDDRPGLSKEDDLLDIPAFLRRQAN